MLCTLIMAEIHHNMATDISHLIYRQAELPRSWPVGIPVHRPVKAIIAILVSSTTGFSFGNCSSLYMRTQTALVAATSSFFFSLSLAFHCPI